MVRSRTEGAPADDTPIVMTVSSEALLGRGANADVDDAASGAADKG